MIGYLLGFVLSFFAAFLITPFVRTLALRLKAIDQPGFRKIHSGEIPRLGGIAIYIGFVLPYFFSLLVLPGDTPVLSDHVLVFFAASLLIFILGVVDDIWGLGAPQKFLIQIIAGILIYWGGFRMDVISLPFGGEIDLGFFGPILTVLWVVGICNAINLVDGLDGLAAGLSSIGALTIFVVSLLSGDPTTAYVSILLVGSTLGFLRHNFYPARIFMGDSGSLFLGFTLAVLSIHSAEKSTLVVPLLIPVVALGLPIADTLFSMVRRYIKGEPLFSADKDHFHHKLVLKGFSHRKAVLILYGISALLGITSILIRLIGPGFSFYFLPVLMICFVGGVRFLGYGEFKEVPALFSSKPIVLRVPRHKRILLEGLVVRLREKRRLAQVREVLEEVGVLLDLDQVSLSLFGLNGDAENTPLEWRGSNANGHPSLWSITVPLKGKEGYIGNITMTKQHADDSYYVSEDMALASATGDTVNQWLLSLDELPETKVFGSTEAVVV